MMQNPAERPKIWALIGFGAVTLGMGITQGSLVPLVHALPKALHVSLPAILVLYSLLSWALLIGSFGAAAVCFRWGARAVVVTASLTLGIGLLLRVISSDYALVALGQGIADLTLPFCFGPIGSVIKAARVKKTRLTTALLFGAMPGGAGIGSVLESWLFKGMGLSGSLWVITIIGLVFAVFALVTSGTLEHFAPTEKRERMRVRPNAWWLVVAFIFSIPNLLQAVYSPAVAHLGIPDAVGTAGLLGFVTNWGAALIPIAVGAIAEFSGASILSWLKWLAVVDVIVVAVFISQLTGVMAWSGGLAVTSAALLGGVAYSVFALLNSMTAQAEQGQRQAGVSTSMLSVSGNVASSVLTPSLGSLIAAGGPAGDVITIILAAIGAASTFIGKPIVGESAASGPIQAVE